MVSTTIYSSDIASAGTATVTVTNGVTTSNTITFEIYPRTCSITATSGANGAVTPAGVTTVNYGGSQSYTITPNTGYHIVDVKVDGISQGPVTSYTFMNVVSDRTISATFVINAYLITASAGTGGSISPGSVNVNYGSSQAFIITPNTGYSVSNVIVDGASKGAITGYTFTNVQASHIISATFLKWGAPTVTSIAPKSAKKGTTLSVTIKGTNFHTGAAVKFSTDTAGSSNVITLTNINVISSTQLTATVTLPNTGIVRYYVWVTNSDGQTGRSSKNIFRQKN